MRPVSVCTRTSTCSATATSPLANRSGLRYRMANGIASTILIFTSSPDERTSYQGGAGRSGGRVEAVLAVDVGGEQPRLHQRLHRVGNHRGASADVGDVTGSARIVLGQQFRYSARAALPVVARQRGPVAEPVMLGGDGLQPLVVVKVRLRRHPVVKHHRALGSRLDEAFEYRFQRRQAGAAAQPQNWFEAGG